MKVLVVKLTSMGDAIHVLPALSDLQSQHPEIQVDWMIEESFAEIPEWHSSVSRVISVATRRWRTLNRNSVREFAVFWKELRTVRYDVVIDAQGLIKSAIFARFARLANKGRRVGFSADSIKESPAAHFYHDKIKIEKEQHAIARLRSLFAKGFDYQVQKLALDFQLQEHASNSSKKVMFLHGTTWASKHLPEQHWHELITLAKEDRYSVLLPWGNEQEKQRAERIAASNSNAQVLPKSNLQELLNTMHTVSGAIAVDTGLGHLAAAIGLPTVSVYGSTNHQLTGAQGKQQVHIQTDFACSPCLFKKCNKLGQDFIHPPCYSTASPAEIWLSFKNLLAHETANA